MALGRYNMRLTLQYPRRRPRDSGARDLRLRLDVVDNKALRRMINYNPTQHHRITYLVRLYVAFELRDRAVGAYPQLRYM